MRPSLLLKDFFIGYLCLQGTIFIPYIPKKEDYSDEFDWIIDQGFLKDEDPLIKKRRGIVKISDKINKRSRLLCGLLLTDAYIGRLF